MAEKTESQRRLVGYHNFVRTNPMSDKFQIERFHHVEFWCSDATTTYKRFELGLGMNMVAKSDLTTGNTKYASYAIQSNELVFVFTSAYNNKTAPPSKTEPHPAYKSETANQFVIDHGLAVRAVGIRVSNAQEAYEVSVRNGAVGVLSPQTLTDAATGHAMTISEIKSVGDVVIRWVSGAYSGPVLPNYDLFPVTVNNSYGLVRADHIVSNVPNLFETVDYLMGAIGLHEFSEFTAEDVGTVDSGLNSMVLASNNEYVLLPVNEPTFGTRRKSQIQNYLEHNNGGGVQHIALKTDDIFKTLREMRKYSGKGGFDFMPCPGQSYYDKIPERLKAGDTIQQLTQGQLAELQELGILADRDEKGILLQIFTKPIGDRPTVFFEIIQRIGCMITKDTSTEEAEAKKQKVEQEAQDKAKDKVQSAGCGGFGKGNFSELFKSIETFEKSQEVASA